MAEIFYSNAKELAGLIGLPGTVQGVINKASRENWEGRMRTGKGGGKEYPESVLPQETRDKLVMSRINATLRLDDVTKELIEAKTPPPVALPVPTPPVATKTPVILDDTQLLRDGSRQLILQFVATAKSNKIGIKKAVALLNDGYAAGSLSPDLMHALENCNDKLNDQRAGKLSQRSVERWKEDKQTQQHCAPKKTRVQTPWHVVPWVALFLACYRKPQKPNLKEAHAEFQQDWVAQGFKEKCPSYHVLFQLRKRIPKVILEMGRSTGSELAALKPFVRRDWSGSSNEVWVGDGHTFKARCVNPSPARRLRRKSR